MVTTPWEIGDRLTRMLADQAARDYEMGALAHGQLNKSMIERQDATTLFGRQLARDEINYQQAQNLQNDRQAFTHEENKLINLDYKLQTKGRGRAGYVGAPRPHAGPSPQAAFAHLTKQGMPPMIAAGIVGNIDVESGWDPAVFSGERLGDAGTAGYAGQWRDVRLANLQRFAQSRGHAQPTFEDQLDFFVHEAQTGSDPGARRAFELASQAQSPEEVAEIFMTHYERPNPDPRVNNVERRKAAARSVFDTGGAGQPYEVGGVNEQRRYGGDTVLPSDTAEATPTNPDELPPLTPWTSQDLIENGFTAFDIAGIPEDMDIVGTEFFSGAALELLDPAMKSRLHPVGGWSPDETNQYLILQPKPGSVRDAYGNTINPATTPSNEIGGPATVSPETVAAPPISNTGGTVQTVPVPNAINAPSVPTPTEAGINIPGPPPVNAPVSVAPTGQRTRRNAQGQLEFLVDGQWRPSGG